MERKPTRVRTDELCGNPRLHLHVPDSRPSWRRYGKGVANVEFTFYAKAGVIGIAAEETAFASETLGQTRDVTRAALLEIDRPAAEALHKALGAWLESADHG